MKLLSMEDALKLNRKETLEKTKKYLSTSMVAAEAILKFDRQYINVNRLRPITLRNDGRTQFAPTGVRSCAPVALVGANCVRPLNLLTLDNTLEQKVVCCMMRMDMNI